VTALPATVSTPERDCVVELAANEYVTVPLPEPVAPLLMVIHDTELDAVHAQPDADVTVTVPLPEPAGADADVGLTV
jgi:hypothetical protein